MLAPIVARAWVWCAHSCRHPRLAGCGGGFLGRFLHVNNPQPISWPPPDFYNTPSYVVVGSCILSQSGQSSDTLLCSTLAVCHLLRRPRSVHSSFFLALLYVVLRDPWHFISSEAIIDKVCGCLGLCSELGLSPLAGLVTFNVYSARTRSLA